MSIDRAKALQSAQKYLAKGQLDRAISEYERLVQADPKDARMLLKLGDLYTRQGAAKDASATYRKVAEQYAEQGFFLKAVAVCKQILKLDPGQIDVWERLAEMYEMLSLVSDAITTYEQVADAQQRANNPRKALRALEKLAELDADNVAARIRYAEALSKLNKPDEAAEAFKLGAEVLKKQGRLEDYVKVGERLLFHQPDNYEFSRELATFYLEREDPKHALAKLQACFNADPKNLETLNLLARAFELLGQTQKTISVLKEMARLLAAEARSSEQASVLRRVLTMDPADPEARQELSQLGRLPGAPVRDASASYQVEEDEFDMVLDDEPEAATSRQGSGARAFAAPEDEHREAKVQRLLDECAVFVRYGLTEKIIAQLEEVLSLDPHHQDAREKLKDAYVKAKRPIDAARQLVALAELAQDPSSAQAYAQQALQLDPNNGSASQLAQRFQQEALQYEQDAQVEQDEELIFVEEAPTSEHAAPAERPEESFESLLPDNEFELQDDGEEPEMVIEDEGSMVETLDDMADAALAADDDDDAEAVVIEADDDDDDDEAVFVVEDTSSDAVPTEPPPAPLAASKPAARMPWDSQAPQAAPSKPAARMPWDSDAPEIVPSKSAARMPWDSDAPEIAPSKPAARMPWDSDAPAAKAARASAAAQLWQDQAQQPPAAAFAATPRPAEPTTPPAASPATDSDADMPEELVEAIGEIDFYLKQELFEEARQTLGDALESYPDHPALIERQQMLDPQRASRTSMPAPIVASNPPDRAFELAQKLAEEVAPLAGPAAGAGPVDVADVLAQFKRGVASQVDAQDAATHYDLGIAYMEMGLHGEAIEEFKLCLGDPQRLCTAHTMIGLSYVAKGDMELGIDHFKLALDTTPNQAEELGLWFELGNAFELLGKNMEALVWYEKVEERDSSFRDVTHRIERLGSARSPEQESDEFDEMFDNMIMKD